MLGPVPITEAPFFRRLIEAGGKVMDSVQPIDDDLVGPLGHYIFSRKPNEVVWVPIMQGERVVAGISALRGARFVHEEQVVSKEPGGIERVSSLSFRK